jgi:hypothetical protein
VLPGASWAGPSAGRSRRCLESQRCLLVQVSGPILLLGGLPRQCQRLVPFGHGQLVEGFRLRHAHADGLGGGTEVAGGSGPLGQPAHQGHVNFRAMSQTGALAPVTGRSPQGG